MIGEWQTGPAICGDPHKIFIRCPDGEGGDFCREEFNSVLESGFIAGDVEGAVFSFFWENF